MLSTIPINVMVYPTGLAEPHSLESTNFPRSQPVVSHSDSRISVVHQTRLSSSLDYNIGSHSHCISDMTAGFLIAQQRKEEATNRSAYFTEWAAHPSFTGQYI